MLTINDFKRLIQPIKNKIFLIVGRGLVKPIDNSKPVQKVQARMLKNEILNRLERFQEYGVETLPFADSEAAVLSLNGNRSLGMILCIQDRRYRPKDLAEGEVVIYNWEDKTSPCRIHFKSGRNIQIIASDIYLGSSNVGDLKTLVNEEFKDLFNEHVHSDPQGGVTGPPTTLMTTDHLTDTTKAK